MTIKDTLPSDFDDIRNSGHYKDLYLSLFNLKVIVFDTHLEFEV